MATRNTLRTIVLGDWGGDDNAPKYTTKAQLSTADAMTYYADKNAIDAVFALGDNFYEKGVGDVTSVRFHYTYEVVYSAKSLQVPWFVIAGNHDHEGNVTAQIAYTGNDKYDRWHFPSLYYTRTLHFSTGSRNVSVLYVMIDTVTLAPYQVRDEFLDDFDVVNPQWAWIESQLNSTKADWIVVCGHFPVYSTGSNGPNSILISKLKPMMEKYGVAFYASGHDHNLQYLEENGVGYVLSGAGHEVAHKQKHAGDVPSGVSQFFWPPQDLSDTGGYVTAEFLDEKNLQLNYLDSDNTLLFTQSITNPR